MKKNRLTSVKEGLLSSNNKLKIVDFSDNNIDDIDQKAFLKNYDLERVNLSTNRIRQLSPDTFEANTKLADVDLSYNRITELDRNIFSKTSIKTLSLRGNVLKIEANMSLFTATVLEKLDLGSCGITSLSSNSFRDMLNLRVLLLDKNRLKLPGQADLNDSVFSGLLTLTKLDLSANEISQFGAHILSNLRGLKLLNLSSNPIMCNKCASEDHDVQNWCSTENVQCDLKCYSFAVSSTNCISTTSDSERTPHSILTENYGKVHSPFSGTSNADLTDSAVTSTQEGVSLEVLFRSDKKRTESYSSVHSTLSGISNADLSDSAVTSTEEAITLEVLLPSDKKRTENYSTVHSIFSGTSNVVLSDSAVTSTEEAISLEVLLWGGVAVVSLVLITAVAVVTIITFITRRRPPVSSV
jgi:hypothetical protein